MFIALKPVDFPLSVGCALSPARRGTSLRPELSIYVALGTKARRFQGARIARAQGEVSTLWEAGHTRDCTGIAPVVSESDGVPEAWRAFDPGDGSILSPAWQCAASPPSPSLPQLATSNVVCSNRLYCRTPLADFPLSARGAPDPARRGAYRKPHRVEDSPSLQETPVAKARGS